MQDYTKDLSISFDPAISFKDIARASQREQQMPLPEFGATYVLGQNINNLSNFLLSLLLVRDQKVIFFMILCSFQWLAKSNQPSLFFLKLLKITANIINDYGLENIELINHYS